MIAAGLGAGLAFSIALANGEEEEEEEEREVSLRDRIIGNYENRVRDMSAPEKVFGYFASLTGPDGEKYMTVEDFIRSLMPYDTEHGNGGAWTRTEGGKKDSPAMKKARKLFSFVDENGDAHISFEEYMFFVTLLSIPPEDFDVAFRMFDRDGNGAVSASEFQQVVKVMMANTPMGRQHRSPSVSQYPRNLSVFFGQNEERQLSFPEFEKFLRFLRETVLELEFEQYDRRNEGALSLKNFALMLVATADQKNLAEYARRAHGLAHRPERVTLPEVKQFHAVLGRIGQIDKAMRMYITAGRPFSREELEHAVQSVTNIRLSSPVMDVLFHMFDINGDGLLDEKEFLKFMHLRSKHGLDKKRDTGVVSFMQCVQGCVKSSF